MTCDVACHYGGAEGERDGHPEGPQLALVSCKKKQNKFQIKQPQNKVCGRVLSLQDQDLMDARGC